MTQLQVVIAATEESQLCDELRRLVRVLHFVRPETANTGGFLGGSDGYGADVETDVFVMRAHTEDPPDCTCEPGKRTGASRDAWYAAGMPQDKPPHDEPCALDCPFNLPNFHHKPSGLQVRWHKWIGRSMEVHGSCADIPAMVSECIRSLVGTLYATIYMDSPWPERGGGKSKRGADRHYPLMTVRKIAALPIGEIAAPDAHLWSWATSNYLADAIDCGRAWGFRYIGCRPWVKAEPQYWGERQQDIWIPQAPGLGQYMRCDAEFLLLFVRGKAMVPKWKPRQTIYAPRGRHSAKPDCVRRDIEKMSPGPRIELFARERHEGWAAWGNEVQSDAAVTAQGALAL